VEGAGGVGNSEWQDKLGGGVGDFLFLSLPPGLGADKGNTCLDMSVCGEGEGSAYRAQI
jgi:hypothetical protein